MLSIPYPVKKEHKSDDGDVKNNPSEMKVETKSGIKQEDAPNNTSTVTDSSKEDTGRSVKANDDEDETENKSDSDSASTEVRNSGDKSIANNNWDNGYSNELQKMYSNVDPDMRAIAEGMIKPVREGNKKIPQQVKEASKSPSRTSDKVPDSITSSDKPTMPTSPKNASTLGGSDGEKDPVTTVINKGKEPSALELALKQQGISQSDQLRSTQFPFRLHNMLDDAERSGHAHIVSWCPGGDSFKIHKPTKLISVLQLYFRQSKFKSFLRQLQGYNFKRITRGKDQGVVSHPLFLRGRRSVSTLMRRKRVGPKLTPVIDPEPSHTNKVAEVAARNDAFKKSSMDNEATTSNAVKATSNTPILPQGAQHTIPLPTTSHTFPPLKPSVAQPPQPVINPSPQDVLCVEYPNAKTAQQFQGNRKLASIVQKITGHYTSANESVRTMIVNEISSRIQNSGSRFLKLNKDGMSWVECNREEMFRKVISCFEQELQMSQKKNPIDLTGDGEVSTPAGVGINKIIGGMPNTSLQGVVGTVNPGRRLSPGTQDVVLRGGPGSEREGNTYLKTMIQANVGQQVESFEMKRIKCRAILERMKRRGSRFFLKLKETDPDEDMYILSDAEAQDVIYTAFCAEEKKIQSLFVEAPTAASMLRAQTLAGLEANHSGLSALTGASQFASRAAALQNDAALLYQLKANYDINLLAAQGHLKRPLQGNPHLTHENLLEKRLRAETDEHIKLLIDRERQRQADTFGANSALAAAAHLPLHARSAVLESTLPLTNAYGAAAAAATTSTIDQLLKERQNDELLLKSAAAARAPFAPVVTHETLSADLPKSNNHFVEFLKKKYVKSAQDRHW
mmetsp:Transcript_6748/g.16574  ORF Transcript_6748/g.16574 Transcript_6748/m.16574 type:complete len:849 (+) Transcript_6748:166-2712(+)